VTLSSHQITRSQKTFKQHLANDIISMLPKTSAQSQVEAALGSILQGMPQTISEET
jgi:hypothetical protein